MSNIPKLTGKFAALYIGGVKILDGHTATVNVQNSFAEGGGWGVKWVERSPLRGDWNVTAEKWTRSVSDMGAILRLAAATPTALVPITVVLYNNENDLAGSKVFEGPGWVDSSTFDLPDSDFNNENFTITSAGAPTYVAGYVPA